jgi:hypothetical protein
MKFQLELARNGNKTVVFWEAGQYDGNPPVKEVVINSRIRNICPERAAVSCALMFFDYICGAFSYDKGVTHEVAIGLQRLFMPRFMIVDNIHFEPRKIPSGCRSALISDDSYRSLATQAIAKSELLFGIQSDQQFISSIGASEVRLDANLRMLYKQNSPANIIRLLGLAILYAEDFVIDNIVIPLSSKELASYINVQYLVDLLQLINITLQFPLDDLSDEEIKAHATNQDHVTAYYYHTRKNNPSIKHWNEFPENY